MSEGNYKTVLHLGEAEIIEKKSRFISYVMPIETEQQAISILDTIRKKHYNASHNAYAYIVGQRGEVQRFSDDGEPNGTAGIPVLNVLKNEGLQNIVVIVTRYFGGTLLGSGGLVRMYSKSAKAGVDAAVIVENILFAQVDVAINYSMSGKLQYELLQQKYTIYDMTYKEDVIYHVLVEVEKKDRFIEFICDITSAQAVLTEVETLRCATIDGKIL